MVYKITEDCVNCGGCIGECPVGAIIEGDEISSIDPEKCVDCGTCVDAFFCPAAAIIPGSDADVPSKDLRAMSQAMIKG